MVNNLHLISDCDILLGDFNFVEDPTKDRYPHTKKKDGIKLGDIFKISTKDMIDIANDKNGFKYTFTNGRVFSRIDRIYVKKNLDISFINTLGFQEGLVSSHAPVLFKTNWLHCPQKKWRLRTYLWCNPYMKKILNKITPKIELGDDWDNYERKLKNAIETKEKKMIRIEKKLVNKAKKMIKIIPKNHRDYLFYSGKIINLNNRIEEVKRVTCYRINERDRSKPSNFLTKRLKSQKKNEAIKQITDPISNSLVRSENDILNAFKNFYGKLYKQIDINYIKLEEFLAFWRPLNYDLNLSFFGDYFSFQELKIILKQSKNFKAPGNDGIPPFVFKNLNDNNLALLLHQYNKFIDGDPIPNKWKVGKIITIFKKGDKDLIDNRRPITLLKTKYKILTKMITNRFYNIINRIIDIEQVGFIPNRNILDNVLVLNELLLKKDKFLISVDYKKAYDSVSHDTIIQTLYHLGFPANFVMLIRNLIFGSSAKVIVNDNITDKFNIERGVKQGDPLSPILFTLIIEILKNIPTLT